MIRRTFVTALTAALLAGTALLAGAALAQGTKITIAHATASDFLPAFVAKEKGIFAKHGLDVTLQVYANIALTPAALMSNQIQIGATTPTNVLLAGEAGLDVVGVVGGSRLQKTNPRIYLVSRPGFTITKPDDLRGKKVGVPGLNAIIDLFLRKWLMDNKVPVKEVTIVEALLPQMPDLLKSGLVDAVTPIEPIVTRIVSSGSGQRSFPFYHDVNPDVIAAFWISSRSWADANRKTVQQFKAAYEEAIDYIQKNPEEGHKIELQYLKVTAPVFPSFSTSITTKDLDDVASIMREVGFLKGPVDTSKLVWK